MNWKSFFLGVGAGLISAYAVREFTERRLNVSADKVLLHAKETFKKAGPITGSWINMNPETYSKGPIEYQVYKGGISRNLSGEVEQYEFIADASSGSILDAYPLN